VSRESQGGAASVERLGRYEILGEIASGGMATVFLGRVTGAKGFQRLVAIKRLHPHLESEEDFVAMFLDEARLAAKIRHPNCVATLDVEDQEGLYIVMEYIEGDRLLGLLRHAAKTGERIPPPVAVRIALDTLAGLHAAHELRDDDGELLGLVHRDVSPQNVLIGVDGVARLTDFGIAKATSRLTVTRDGQLKGKIAYMAPEQTKRVEIDRRVDIFAMGIITWEMLTSKKLFNGESDVEVLNQLLFEPIPRLKDSAPGIPAALDAVVMKALERDPAKRYSTALEFAEALERASKVFGGPANARTVAAHLQKVSAEKLAKDRARITTGAPDPTGGTPSGVKRRPTVMGIGVPAAAMAPPPPPPPPPARERMPSQVGLPVAPACTPSNPPVVSAEVSLLDDDEDMPTQALARADVIASAARKMAPPPPPQNVPPPAPAPAAARKQTLVMGSAALDAPAAAPPGPPPVRERVPSNMALPAVSLPSPADAPPSAAMPAFTAPAASPPTPPPTAAAAPLGPPVTFDLPDVPEAPAKRGNKGLVLGLLGVLVVGGGAAAFVFTRSSSSTPTPPATRAQAAPRAAPTPTAPVEPRAATPPSTPSPAATADAAAAPATPTAATATADAGTAIPQASPQPQANDTTPSAPTEQGSTTSATGSTTGTHRPRNGRSNSGSGTTAGTSTSGTAGSSNTGHAGHGTSGPSGSHANDDPFGNDNPYQR
jgi:serine/threonine-protein kinase